MSPMVDAVYCDNLHRRAKNPSCVSDAQKRANSLIREEASSSDKTIGKRDQIADNELLLIWTIMAILAHQLNKPRFDVRPKPRFNVNITRPDFLSKRQNRTTDVADGVPTAPNGSATTDERLDLSNQIDKRDPSNLPRLLRQGEKRYYKALSQGTLELHHLHLAQAMATIDPPANFKEALERPDAQLWINAVKWPL